MSPSIAQSHPTPPAPHLPKDRGNHPREYLTIREHMAIEFLKGRLVNGGVMFSAKDFAEAAVERADALLAALER